MFYQSLPMLMFTKQIQETQKDLSQGEQPKTISAFCDFVFYNIHKDIQELHNMRSKIEKSYQDSREKGWSAYQVCRIPFK